MRLLADLSSWLQRHALMATDLNEQRRHAFLHDRSQRCRAHRDDRATLRRLLAHLREQGVLPIPMVELHRGMHSHMACDFQHSLLSQRCLAPRTVQSSRDTVQRLLGARFGALPLRLEGLCARDVADCMVQQARQYSPTRAKVMATALRSFCRFLLPHGAITNDLAHAVPTVPNWRLSTLPKFLKAEDVACLLQPCARRTPHGQRDEAIGLLLARLG